MCYTRSPALISSGSGWKGNLMQQLSDRSARLACSNLRPACCTRWAWAYALGAGFLGACAGGVGFANAGPSGGHRVEAESPKPKSDSRVVAVEGIEGVTSDRAWEPVFSTDILGDWAGQARVWVRHSGGPLNLKARRDGEQHDLAWVWGSPVNMTWSSFGAFDRDKLGDGVVLIRGNQGSPVVDAVVFEPVGTDAAPVVPAVMNETAAATDLPSAIPSRDASPIETSVFIDWSRSLGAIAPEHWAVNDYSVIKDELAGQPEFNAYVDELDPAAVRVHWAEMTEHWTDPQTRAWDAAAMKANLDAAVGLHGADLMFNITWWPKWLHDGNVLPAEKEEEFIRLCGELPKVMREIGHPVAMIEVINEREGHYEKAGELPRLWSLYARCVEAIRASDPDVLVGGPALTWPKPAWVKSFIEHEGLAYSDFFTWHNYASGKATDSNEHVFAAADRLGRHAADTMQALADAGYPDMPGYLTEYNVSWAWTTRDTRMGNNVGAVFQALVIKNLAEAGASGAFVWHVQDNIYGLLKSDGTRRAPADLFLWGKHLVGDMHPVATQDTNAIEGMAVRRKDGERAVLLMIKSDRPVRVFPGDSLTSDGPWRTVEAIVPEGFAEPAWAPGQPIDLPGYSLLLLSTAP